MAFAAAIEMELWAIERRGHVSFVKSLLPQYDAGEAVQLYGFTTKDSARNQFIDAHLDKVGLLGGELPSEVIRFTQFTWGVRVDLSRLVAGELGTDGPMIARIIRQDLAIIAELQILGPDLVRRLRRSAGW